MSKINPSETSSHYLNDPDVRLMLEFQEGNKASFETLMKKFYPRLLNFINRYVGIREIAEDLTQEVFIKVYNNAANYQPKAKFSTWVFTIARNISLNELRTHKRKTISLDESFQAPGGQLQRQIADDTATNPNEDLVKQERIAAIKKAIHELPENQRVAVLLRRYEDFSYEEIAQSMNTTVKAVKSLLNRAKENLRNILSSTLLN